MNRTKYDEYLKDKYHREQAERHAKGDYAFGYNTYFDEKFDSPIFENAYIRLIGSKGDAKIDYGEEYCDIQDDHCWFQAKNEDSDIIDDLYYSASKYFKTGTYTVERFKNMCEKFYNQYLGEGEYWIGDVEGESWVDDDGNERWLQFEWASSESSAQMWLYFIIGWYNDDDDE